MDAVVLAPSQSHPVSCSPWDQSGWRCERGRCRCSRSRWRAPQHRRRTSSPARGTAAPTRAASVGAVAAAAPGRSFFSLYTANVRSYLTGLVLGPTNGRKSPYYRKITACDKTIMITTPGILCGCDLNAVFAYCACI